MQSLKSNKVLRNPLTWGATAMVFAVVVVLILVYVHVNPPGKGQLVSFYTNDANAVRSGEEVRIAGIKVGTVSNLKLETNQVLVTAKIDDTAFVGDQSQVDVRMLTIVGGYYVNLNSMGDAKLGKKIIPLSHVTMPYSLIQTLVDTTKITQNVNTKPINESLNQVSTGLSGTNVEVVAATIDAGNALMSTIERQRGQVTNILNLSNEYIKSLNDYRDNLATLVKKLALTTQTLVIYDKGFSATLHGLGDTLLALKPVGDFYDAHRLEFIERVRDFLERGRLFVERNGVTIRLLKRFQSLFDRVLDAQNAPPGLLATDLCMPTPGSPC